MPALSQSTSLEPEGPAPWLQRKETNMREESLAIEILEILSDIRPDVDLENEQQLVTDGILESFDIVSLVADLSDEFDITIRPKDLTPANFNSLDAITALVARLMEE